MPKGVRLVGVTVSNFERAADDGQVLPLFEPALEAVAP